MAGDPAAHRGPPRAVRMCWPPFQQDRDRLADLIAAADVVVSASTTETSGLAALEALASGTPVVATDVGCMTEHVVCSGAGAIFPWRGGTPANVTNVSRCATIWHCGELSSTFRVASRLSVFAGGTGARRRNRGHGAWSAQMIAAVEERDRYCLHRSAGKPFCYQPTSHVLVRPSDGFATPVCDAHVEAAQLDLKGHFEVVPLELWLAEAAGMS